MRSKYFTLYYQTSDTKVIFIQRVFLHSKATNELTFAVDGNQPRTTKTAIKKQELSKTGEFNAASELSTS